MEALRERLTGVCVWVYVWVCNFYDSVMDCDDVLHHHSTSTEELHSGTSGRVCVFVVQAVSVDIHTCALL